MADMRGIANPDRPTRASLVGMIREMGPTLAERAVRYDLEASFPFENFADFRRHGLL